jgi:hypothetical protein
VKKQQPIEIYKVLICGDREWKPVYARIIRREVRELARKHGTGKLLIIEGGAPGVDSLVKTASRKLNIHVAEIDALWDTRGNGAGMQRNKIMAALRPDEVIGIHESIGESKGTAGMLEIAKALGIPSRLVSA